MTGSEYPQLEIPTRLDRWDVVVGGSRVHFGPGRLAETAAIVQELDATRPLLITDPGVRATGRVDQVAAQLRGADRDPQIFDAVHENPTTAVVVAATEMAAIHGADLLIGLGGGSSMDTAKGVNFLLSNGGAMEDYWGVDKATRPMLPSIGIPTTAGTGSEAQRFALISRVDDHRKMACGDEKARFRHVILDPELTTTVPSAVAVATGMDALTHAVESHVSNRSNRVSRLYSREAWVLLSSSYERSLEPDVDLDTRSRMLLGAHLAGAAIECSMLGAAHACANPLTARFDITHGIAVGLILPHVVRFNTEAAADGYAQLEATGAAGSGPLAGILERLFAASGVSPRLRDHGVSGADLGALAADAADEWTANFNPRAVGKAELKMIYEQAL